MKASLTRSLFACLALFQACSALPIFAQSVLFHDPFEGRLAEGWEWRRENPDGWRITPRGLEIRVEPGNMWGPANDAKNVLFRPVPYSRKQPLEITVEVKNEPTEQYEQVDLVWYYDDSHMVKIGQELVDGQLSIVMGREEKDRTRTLAIIPIEALTLRLRFVVKENSIEGYFAPVGEGAWRKAGECDLPEHGAPKIALQCYQGPAKAERWARIKDFVIRRID